MSSDSDSTTVGSVMTGEKVSERVYGFVRFEYGRGVIRVEELGVDGKWCAGTDCGIFDGFIGVIVQKRRGRDKIVRRDMPRWRRVLGGKVLEP
jgi:hypothetical protein